MLLLAADYCGANSCSLRTTHCSQLTAYYHCLITGFTVGKSLEVTDSAELSEDFLRSELYPAVAEQANK